MKTKSILPQSEREPLLHFFPKKITIAFSGKKPGNHTINSFSW